jgi:micrococcal nuclease
MKLILLFLISLMNSAAIAESTYGNVYVSRVVSVYDGDTFRVDINKYPIIVGADVPIRINGIDTPELKAKCALEKRLAIRARTLTVKKLKMGKVIELRNIKRGKYFRIVADVYVDNSNLGEELIAAGLAVNYSGGGKVKDWCSIGN